MNTLHQHVDGHQRFAIRIRTQARGVVANSQRDRRTVGDLSANPVDQLEFGTIHRRAKNAQGIKINEG